MLLVASFSSVCGGSVLGWEVFSWGEGEKLGMETWGGGGAPGDDR